jgi:ligand-binding SRPBCC domain-containing protein
VTRIELETLIRAPQELCFDLARSVDVHLHLAERSQERTVAGRTTGLLELGDDVTWEGRHLGLTRRLAVRITQFDRPTSFRDEGEGGGIRRLVHEHFFLARQGGTLMVDRFEVESVLRLLDRALLKPYFERFLRERSEGLRRLAESGEGESFLLSVG